MIAKKFKFDYKQYLTKQSAIIAAVLIVIIFFIYMIQGGLFAKATVVDGMSDQYIMVFKSMDGSYGKSSKVSNEICNWLESADIEVFETLSYYFDDPMEEDTEDLRYIAGCTMGRNDYERLDFVMNKYSVEMFFPVRSIAITLPSTNKFSKLMGVLKAYPKLGRYREKKQYPKNAFLKVVDIKKKEATYLMPIQEGFDAVGRYH